jgi:hypothetical protein
VNSNNMIPQTQNQQFRPQQQPSVQNPNNANANINPNANSLMGSGIQQQQQQQPQQLSPLAGSAPMMSNGQFQGANGLAQSQPPPQPASSTNRARRAYAPNPGMSADTVFANGIAQQQPQTGLMQPVNGQAGNPYSAPAQPQQPFSSQMHQMNEVNQITENLQHLGLAPPGPAFPAPVAGLQQGFKGASTNQVHYQI